MPTHPDAPEPRQRILALTMAVWVVGFAIFGAFHRLRENAGDDPKRAWSFLVDSDEERFRRALGTHAELCKVIAERVPEREEIVYHAAARATDRIAPARYQQLNNLIFPRRLELTTVPIDAFPEDAEAWRAYGTGHRFLLQRTRELATEDHWELIHDAGWVRLLRLREDGE